MGYQVLLIMTITMSIVVFLDVSESIIRYVCCGILDIRFSFLAMHTYSNKFNIWILLWNVYLITMLKLSRSWQERSSGCLISCPPKKKDCYINMNPYTTSSSVMFFFLCFLSCMVMYRAIFSISFTKTTWVVQKAKPPKSLCSVWHPKVLAANVRDVLGVSDKLGVVVGINEAPSDPRFQTPNIAVYLTFHQNDICLHKLDFFFSNTWNNIVLCHVLKKKKSLFWFRVLTSLPCSYCRSFPPTLPLPCWHLQGLEVEAFHLTWWSWRYFSASDTCQIGDQRGVSVTVGVVVQS